MANFQNSALSIYTHSNSQSPTLSQKAFNSKDAAYFLEQNAIIKTLKMPVFPNRNLSHVKQTVYNCVLRILWLSVGKIAVLEAKIQKSYLEKLLNHKYTK